jgi:hypothetical protein
LSQRNLEKEEQMQRNRYFIIDTGSKMISIAETIEDTMRQNEYHYVSYLTSQDHYLAIEEIDEDEFLNHFKKSTNGKT